MKKISLSLFLIFQITAIIAQNRDIVRIEKYYNQKNYEKCIEQSRKTIKKYPKLAEAYYYQSLSNFNMFKHSPRLRKKYYLTNTLTNLTIASRIDTSKKFFDKYQNDFMLIKDSTLSFAKKLYKTDKSESAYFFKSLVAIYHDTTDEYRDLFIPKKKEIKQQLAFREYNGPINQKDMSGNRQGLWIEKYPNGIVRYEIYFKDNHPAGVFRKYYPNGNLKVKMYFDSKGKRASAIFYDKEGHKVAMGYFNNRKKDSLWQYYANDTMVIAEESYKNGVKNGAERIYSTVSYPNILDEKFWKNGKLDSIWTRSYPDGTPEYIAQYKNGKRNGTYTAFDVNGRAVVIGQYKDDVSVGTWKYWNDSTKTYIKIKYINGVPQNLKQLTDQETAALEKMQKLKGKFEEPMQVIQKKYGGDEN